MQVSRTDVWITTISVDADSIDQAKEKVLSLAPYAYFETEVDPVYNIDTITELVPSVINPLSK